MQLTNALLASALALATVSSSPVHLARQEPTTSVTSDAAFSSVASSTASGAAASSSTGAAAPDASDSPESPAPASGSGLNDTQILQFALTLEHLEAAFYNQSIAKFGDEDFQSAGLNSTVRDQIYAIGQDEASHVDFLSTALGNSSVSPCTYNFSAVTDVPSFLATAQVLEGVGTSAYLGAAKLITDKMYLESAGSILTVESRHATYINSALAQQNGSQANVVPAPFDTPLNATQVYSLAAPFIASCPDNSTLPFKAFPAATIAPAAAQGNDESKEAVNSITPGSSLQVKFDQSELPQSQDGTNSTNSTNYVAIVSGPTPPVFLPLGDNNTIQLPANMTGGTFYAIVTSSNSSVTDDNTLAGPAVAFVNVPLPKAPAASSSATMSASESSATPAATGAAGNNSTGSDSASTLTSTSDDADATGTSISGSATQSRGPASTSTSSA